MAGAGNFAAMKMATADERQAAHWQVHDRLVHSDLEARGRAIDFLKDWARPGVPHVDR